MGSEGVRRSQFAAWTSCEPFVKFPGGKRRLLPFLLPLIPPRLGRYFEPFLGGGALFFALHPRKAILSDTDQDLINCYLQVRDDCTSVVRSLRRLPNSETAYYKVRRSRPRVPATRAARIIYLTTLSFNGIYRRNRNGEFNVPYGQKGHLAPCDLDRLSTASQALASAKIGCGDFEEAVHSAKRGDLVFFDPPYTVAHEQNGFIKYNARIFSWDDQIRLSRVARRLSLKGCTVIVSNAHHSSITSLYPNFVSHVVDRPSTIAASTTYRGRMRECLFVG